LKKFLKAVEEILKLEGRTAPDEKESLKKLDLCKSTVK
jgi:hypothetical protein